MNPRGAAVLGARAGRCGLVEPRSKKNGTLSGIPTDIQPITNNNRKWVLIHPFLKAGGLTYGTDGTEQIVPCGG